MQQILFGKFWSKTNCAINYSIPGFGQVRTTLNLIHQNFQAVLSLFELDTFRLTLSEWNWTSRHICCHDVSLQPHKRHLSSTYWVERLPHYGKGKGQPYYHRSGYSCSFTLYWLQACILVIKVCHLVSKHVTAGFKLSDTFQLMNLEN